MDSLSQPAYKLCHVESLPLLELVDDGGAVLLEDVLAELLLLGASLLHIEHTLVGVHNILHGMAVVLVAKLVDLVGGVVGVVDGHVLVVPGPGAQGLNMDGVTRLSGASQHTGDQHHKPQHILD